MTAPHNSRYTRRMRFQIAFSTFAMATALLAAGATAAAQAEPFSFKTVEFMAESQREPAARAFVHDAIQPGMPIAAAIQALKTAGAFCHPPKGDRVLCTHSSFQRHPFHDFTDVTWTVTVLAAPDGRVSSAEVVRTTQE
jgi:hypothetical protein